MVEKNEGEDPLETYLRSLSEEADEDAELANTLDSLGMPALSEDALSEALKKYRELKRLRGQSEGN